LQGRGISYIRQQQIHHENGIVRGWAVLRK